MKKLCSLFLIALLAISCGDDKSYSPEEEEFSESKDADSTRTGHHSHRQGYSSSSKKGSSDSKNPWEKHDKTDTTNHSGVSVPKLDSIVVDTSVVTSKKELPPCSAQNEGESFLVDESSELYFCINGEWRTSVIGVVKATCADGELKVDPFTASDAAEAEDPTLAGTYRRVAGPGGGSGSKGAVPPRGFGQDY